MILKDHNDSNVTFTLTGEDVKSQVFIQMDGTDADTRVGLNFVQDIPALGSKASHRVTVKPYIQQVSAETGEVRQGSVSVLMTIPPGMTETEVRVMAAYARSAIADANIANLVKGGRLA